MKYLHIEALARLRMHICLISPSIVKGHGLVKSEREVCAVPVPYPLSLHKGANDGYIEAGKHAEWCQMRLVKCGC